MSPRYQRGMIALETITSHGCAIGWKQGGNYEDYLAYEVVTWTEREDSSPGFYAVFRIFYEQNIEPMKPDFAEMFCFYDGLNPKRDDPGNPKLYTRQEALEFMANYGYEEIS